MSITGCSELELELDAGGREAAAYCPVAIVFDQNLPNWVVSANTSNTFKSRLDKFWQNQDVIYNFKAQIHGTGSRSKSMCDSVN